MPTGWRPRSWVGSVLPEPRRTRRAVGALLLLAGLGAAALVLIAVLAPPRPWEAGIGPAALGAVAAAGVVLAGLWGAWTLLDHHWAQLARLRRRIEVGEPPAPIAEAGHRRQGDAEELAALAAAIAEAPDVRLTQILAALPEAVLVVTQTGLVSLVNGAAKAAFADRVGVGTSIFDALDRESFAAALARAHGERRPLVAELRDVAGGEVLLTLAPLGDGGAVVTCPAWEVGGGGTLEQDLRLHERPPPRAPLAPGTPLEALPVLSLDTETTGLDAARDRVVSLAAVPMHGGRIYRADALDRLVDPGLPIPARSTAIHGISDAMVRAAPRIPEVLGELAPLLEGRVMVGHSIGFDCAVLRREAERCGLPWLDPVCLDTAQLAAVLLPGLSDLNLETVAAELGVSPVGRHTALGDALTAAEIYSRLLPLLHKAEARTLGDAAALAARAVHLRRAQRKAGW